MNYPAKYFVLEQGELPEVSGGGLLDVFDRVTAYTFQNQFLGSMRTAVWNCLLQKSLQPTVDWAKDFWQMIRNVVMLNFWSLIFCFPAPIILAIMLNELRLSKVKKIVQTTTFYFHGSFRGTGDSISFTVNRNHWIYHEILRNGANLAYG